jgi:hypothetical protein
MSQRWINLITVVVVILLMIACVYLPTSPKLKCEDNPIYKPYLDSIKLDYLRRGLDTSTVTCRIFTNIPIDSTTW